jgi:hypothetical protein
MSEDEYRQRFPALQQLRHAEASHRIDRTGWTDEQWVEDARRLMGDLDGSVLDLVNGHVLALLRTVDKGTEGGGGHE